MLAASAIVFALAALVWAVIGLAVAVFLYRMGRGH